MDRTENEAQQQAAEHTALETTFVGTVLGAVGGAVLWMGIVTLGLMGSDVALAAPLAMAAAVGVFGGAFLGGWAGITAACPGLERNEHKLLPAVPEVRAVEAGNTLESEAA